MLQTIASLVGWSVLAYWLYVLAYRVAWLRLFRPATSWEHFRGEWALVTGSSSGIGRSIAIELAKRGMNIALVARSEDKLKAVAKCIANQFPSAQTLVIAADLTGGQDVFDRIKSALGKRIVSVCIANAGGNAAAESDNEFFKEFVKTPIAEEDAIHRLNIYGVTQTVRLVLPRMIEAGRGRVMTVGSVGVFAPYGVGLYASAKAHIMKLTEVLQAECQSAGLQVVP